MRFFLMGQPGTADKDEVNPREGVNPRRERAARMSLERKLPLLMSGIFIVVFAASLTATYSSLRRAARETAAAALSHATQQLAKLGETGVAALRPRYRAVALAPGARAALAVAMKSPSRITATRGDSSIPRSIGAALATLRSPTDSGLPIELWTPDRRLVAFIGNDPTTIPAANSGSTIVRKPEIPFDGIENIGTADSVRLGRMFLADGRVTFWTVMPVLDSGRLLAYVAKEGRIAVNPQTDRSLRALTGESVSMYYRNDDGSLWTTLSGRAALPSQRVPDAVGVARRPDVGNVLIDEQPIPGTPLVIVMENPEADVFAGPRAIVRSLALLSLLFLVAGTMASWMIARRIARPLHGITIAAEAIARGDYETRVPPIGDDEIVRLSEAFNHMAGEIAEGHSALERQTTEAQAASKAKSDFLATMSHELRTPLNAIGGYVALIEMGLRGPVSDAQRRDLNRVRLSQQHLLGLISAMLDLGRIETGRVSYDLEPIPLDGFLASLDALIAPQALAKSIELVYEPIEPTLGTFADREKLRQVVLNLMSNAIRHTPASGRITLGAAAQTADVVVIHVIDTGPGIPRDKQEQIFEPFVQLDRSLAQPQDGVGLGLAISRDLARGMGGDLTVDSELRDGASFAISLPRAFVASGMIASTAETPTSFAPPAR